MDTAVQIECGVAQAELLGHDRRRLFKMVTFVTVVSLVFTW